MKNHFSPFLLCSSLAILSGSPAFAAGFTVSSNSTTAQTISSGTGTVNNGITLNVGSGGNSPSGNGTPAVTVTGSSTVTNNGTIEELDTASSSAQNGRGIYLNTANVTLTINNNAGALIKTGDADGIQVNKKSDSVTMYNYGTVTSLNASGGGAQAIDFNAVSTGSNTLYNYYSGVLQASEADAVRPGVNGIVYNSGTIKSTSTTGSSSDGIDAQTNSGVSITNAATQTAGANATNLIEGARHGITGGDVTGGVYTMSVTNNAGGTIQGDNGSGINIDGINAKELVTVTNAGTITGNGVTGDGDGVDVDGLVNINNSGTIQSLNALNDTSEGVTVGGGTIVNTSTGVIKGAISTTTNNTGTGRGITIAGVDKDSSDNPIPVQPIYGTTSIDNAGLIQGTSDSGIAVLGGASGFTTTITNESTGTIEGGGSVAVIQTNANDVAVVTSGKIIANGTGKAIDLGTGTNNTVKILGGTITGDISGSTGTGSKLTIDPGSAGSFSYGGKISNFGSVAINSGTVTLSGASSYTGATAIQGATVNLSGSIATSATAIGSGALHLENGTAGSVALNSGGSLTGNGTVGALTVNSGGLLSPGNSPGVINAGNTVFNSGGAMLLQVDTNGSTGTAGVNWDQLAITGTLDVSTLSPVGTFQFQLQTLTSADAPGSLGAFDSSIDHTWADVITTTGGLVGSLNNTSFTFDTSLFANSTAGGTFSLTRDALNADDLDLHFTATPEPSTWAMLAGGFVVLLVAGRARQQKKI